LTAALEFDELTTRMTLSIGFIALGLIGAAGLYVFKIATPACRSVQTVGRVYEILRDDFHLDSILLNNPTTVSGGFFSADHDCSAEVTQIRGNVNASALPWREIRYHIVHQENSQPPTITVELGGNVPLAPPAASLWERLLAYL
jgi:hypothetical protein